MKDWLDGFFGGRKDKNAKDKEENKEKKEKISARSYMYARYMDCVQQCPVEEKTVLLESSRGTKLEDNIRVLLRTLSRAPEYQEYSIYLACEKNRADERQDYLKWCGAERVKVVIFDTDEYYRLLATAKYLFNDGNFFGQFIKRQEQVYVRIWNRIARYPAGKWQSTGYSGIGGTQKNLFCADYLMLSNELTLERIAEDYMISNFGQSRVLYAGRLQVDELFDKDYQEKLRKEYHLAGKQVIGYYPVIKNTRTKEGLERNHQLFREKLRILDDSLTERQMVFISLPYDVREGLDFKEYKHILPVPRSYRRYQLLSVADVLVTDNMDLMLDFAVTGRKQILFTYDERRKIEDEMELSLRKELPYPKAVTMEEVVMEINSGIAYEDTTLRHKYCAHINEGMTKIVLDKVFKNKENNKLIIGKVPDNGRRNVLIYPGALVKNGITASVISLLDHLDREKNNYMILFRTEAVKDREECLKELPEGVSYYGYTKYKTVPTEDIKKYQNWLTNRGSAHAKAEKLLERRAEWERERLLKFCRVDDVIHYDGYGEDLMLLFEKMPCNKILYVHNDMVQEIKKKKAVRKEVLSRAYHNYDYVALVSEEQRVKTETVASYAKDRSLPQPNIVLAKNVINCERVQEQTRKPFSIDALTEMNVSEDQLKKLLKSNKKKFVTIGRFSKEKGHLRLISAFEKLHREQPDTCLIILGGYGPMFEKTMERANKSEAKDSIVIIQYLSNPYALLKQCDYFVLSSFYEGLPVVLTEADLVGIPCFSTDIPGPDKFMKQYGGMLVENSEAGVLDGMKKCLSGEVPAKLSIDYEQYNREAVELFEAMLQ